MVETNKKQGIRRAIIRWLWWAAFCASVALALASIPGYLQQFQELELSDGLAAVQQVAVWSAILLSVGATVLCMAMALLAFLKRPGEPMAMFLSFFLMFYAVLMLGPLERFLYYWLPQSGDLALLLQTILFSPITCWLLLVFPNGRFTPRWTRWLVVFSFLATAALLLILSMDEWVRMTTTRSRVGYAIIDAFTVLAIGVQFYRYRRVYSLVERQQTKWVLIGIVATFLLAGFLSVPYYYMLNLPPGSAQPWWEPLGGAGWWFTMIILPVSLTFAILRYRLFDIDVIIRRTLVYASLTATLAVVYFASVVLIQALFTVVSGQQSAVAIVISTLVIAALFTPLRRRIQNDIDRRFFRKKYDAEKVVAAFGAGLRQEVDLDDLQNQIVAVVQETLQPEMVILWLRPSRERKNIL